MLDQNGGFYSTQDADSEGEEGKFFLWTPRQCHEILENVLDKNIINAVLDYWDVTPGGNFEGQNILHVNDKAASAAAQHHLAIEEFLAHLETARQALFEAREKRIKQGRLFRQIPQPTDLGVAEE